MEESVEVKTSVSVGRSEEGDPGCVMKQKKMLDRTSEPCYIVYEVLDELLRTLGEKSIPPVDPFLIDIESINKEMLDYAALANLQVEDDKSIEQMVVGNNDNDILEELFSHCLEKDELFDICLEEDLDEEDNNAAQEFDEKDVAASLLVVKVDLSDRKQTVVETKVKQKKEESCQVCRSYIESQWQE